jgi:hypothetical protein
MLAFAQKPIYVMAITLHKQGMASIRKSKLKMASF